MFFNKSLIFTLVLVTISLYPLFPQKVLKTHDLNLKSSGTDFLGFGGSEAQIVPLFSDQTDKGALFILDKSNMMLQEFDMDFNFLSSISSQKEGDFRDLLGGFKHDIGYSIFFEGKKKNSFFRLIYDITSNSKSIQEIIVGKKERYLNSISDNNKFILLTIEKGTSIIHTYEFLDEDYKHFTYNLNDVYFKDGYFPMHFFLPKNLTYISQNTPSSFSQTFQDFKYYLDGSIIYITFDNLYNLTEIVTLNIEDGSSTQKKYIKNFQVCQNQYNTPTTNTIIHNNKLFTVVICDKAMNFTIKDLQTEINITSYSAFENDPINFKNSELIQDGGGTVYSSDRFFSLKSTKKFLSKSDKSKAAVAIEYDNAKSLQIKLGSYKDVYANTGGGSFTPGSSISTPYGSVTTAPTFNPALSAYSSDSWSKTTYFKTILSKNTFRHLKNPSQKSLFDKINEFANGLNSQPKFMTIFKFKGGIIYCYYDKANKKLNFVKF